jgi:hypothetical protein
MFPKNVSVFAKNVSFFAENVSLFAENVSLFAVEAKTKHFELYFTSSQVKKV